ncbi:hypothetical protein LBMAG35_13320 [Chlorobiota bacterium]|jgi:hypothetical protein|nr:hypothetical protein LBMAG35_13320 [Chlorobiota bacterium]
MLFACSSSKVQTDNSHSNVHAINVADSMYALRVSFFSIGSGIDGKAKQEYEQYINEFQTINNVTIVLNKTSWGKEGEIDYCIKLAGLTKELQQEFIQSTKDKFKDSKRIRLYENTTCTSNK